MITNIECDDTIDGSNLTKPLLIFLLFSTCSKTFFLINPHKTNKLHESALLQCINIEIKITTEVTKKYMKQDGSVLFFLETLNNQLGSVTGDSKDISEQFLNIRCDDSLDL